MDKTPKGKSLRFVRQTENTNSTISKTVVEDRKQRRIWENDFCSQESVADVEWDWDSPKNIKPKIRRISKQQLRKSPKAVPKKSHIDHTKNYEKLRGELQALRDEIAKVEDDDCLPVSPIDEQTVKEESEYDVIDNFIEEQYFQIDNLVKENYKKSENEPKNTINDMLNDSWDDELLKCTQILEEKIVNETIPNNFKTSLGITPIKNLDEINKKLRKEFEINESGDDSFDAVLKELKDEDFDVLSQSTNKSFRLETTENFNRTNFSFIPKITSNNSFKRTFSDAHVQYVPNKDRIEKVNKFNFHRTHSFESASTSQEETMPKHVIEEIERKRKEALAKLKQKGKEKCPKFANNNISPMKCSLEEIEQKRLQAKAIREAKQRAIIEKNRQEALKRLEMNRIKKFIK